MAAAVLEGMNQTFSSLESGLKNEFCENVDSSTATEQNIVFEVLSDGEILVEVPTTPENEKDYDILIQGSDRQHPAIVVRRKYRGVGATIKTVSRRKLNGQINPEYDGYTETIQAYLIRRDNRRRNATGGNVIQDNTHPPKEEWLDKTIQGVVERSDNSS